MKNLGEDGQRGGQIEELLTGRSDAFVTRPSRFIFSSANSGESQSFTKLLITQTSGFTHMNRLKVQCGLQFSFSL